MRCCTPAVRACRSMRPAPSYDVSRGNVSFTGEVLAYRSKARRGGDAVRNSCPVCGGLVFGGELEISDSFTIYAGSLDDPRVFHPTIAIFARSRPPWVVIPPGLTVFEELPPQPA
jgi:hypothetical protein